MEVLFETPHVLARRQDDGRLHVLRDGKMICNVAITRIVRVASEPDPDDATHAWLALHGATDRVDFARRRAGVGLVGPLPSADATALATVLNEKLRLPQVPRTVDASQLRDDPEALHEQLIVCEGEWTFGKDQSDFCGAWLYVPIGFSGPEQKSGSMRVRVVGFFRCTGSRDFDDKRDGHGPFGLAGSELEAVTLET